jgi:hypothetical protein
VNLGYCGLDRARSPLNGDEIRPCWETHATTSQAVIEVEPRQPGEVTAAGGGFFWGDSER